MKSLIIASGVSLFRLAATELGDASQFARIARANRLYDPVITGTRSVKIPPKDPDARRGLPD